VNPSGQVGAEPAPKGKEMTYTSARRAAANSGGIRSDRCPFESGRFSSPVEDVARIELGALNYQQRARVNGQPGCIVAIFQTPVRTR